MGEAKVRDATKFASIDHIRDHIRANFPHTDRSNGLVVQDLDLVVRVYGPDYGDDATGRFMVWELKHGTAGLSAGQVATFRMVDRIIRNGDTEGRYHGFWLVNYRLNGCEPEFLRAKRCFYACEPVELRGHDAVSELLGTVEIPPQWLNREPS